MKTFLGTLLGDIVEFAHLPKMLVGSAVVFLSGLFVSYLGIIFLQGGQDGFTVLPLIIYFLGVALAVGSQTFFFVKSKRFLGAMGVGSLTVMYLFAVAYLAQISHLFYALCLIPPFLVDFLWVLLLLMAYRWPMPSPPVYSAVPVEEGGVTFDVAHPTDFPE